MKVAIIFLSFALFSGVGSCSAGAVKPNMQDKDQNLANGVWGGQHVRAEVTDNGVEIEFDCARGTIPKRIILNNSHQFDVTGTFAPEHAGPVRDDESSTGRPARYKGTVDQQELTLTISDPNTKEVIGTFTLKFGNEGRLMKCR